MITRSDINARMDGEFSLNERSFRLHGNPLGEETAHDLGLEDYHMATNIVWERYREGSDFLGLYKDKTEHFWEARRQGDKYVLVHVGDWVDYLQFVDTEALWITEGIEIAGTYYDEHEDPDLPVWGNLRKCAENEEAYNQSERIIMRRAAEILELQASKGGGADDGKESS